ncbi:MAG: hypothetical protein AVDCRST_MAG40-2173, partial [uncultured Gemmatimonadaceae bacterium]
RDPGRGARAGRGPGPRPAAGRPGAAARALRGADRGEQRRARPDGALRRGRGRDAHV